MSDYTTALALTLVIELPIYLVGITFCAARCWQAALVIGLGVNLVSHPIAFLAVYPMLEGRVGAAAALVVTELSVVLGEAAMMWLRRIPPTIALLTSSGANIASLVLGVAIIR